jgi:porphobilinogen synthase
MMDHRVAHIRRELDDNDLLDTAILAYSAKFASAYYGPFRDAAHSAPSSGDRKTYQMDPRNPREAIREIQLDEAEGADAVMVKPALAYLDILHAARAATSLPVVAYNVSGEYSMVKAAAEAGLVDEGAIVRENLTAMRRAGADLIITYHARDAIKNGWLA